MHVTLPVYAVCCCCQTVAEEDEMSFCTACGKHICCAPLTERTPCYCDCTPTTEERYYRLQDAIVRRFLLIRKGHTQVTIL